MLVLLLCTCIQISNAIIMQNYANALDHPMDFKCPQHSSITRIGSQHDNGKEDRQYGFECAIVKAEALALKNESCVWSDYVNNFDAPVVYQCPENSYMSGMSSYHDNHSEDRRFKFYCCYTPGYHMLDCEYSGFVNQYDQPFDYRLTPGKVLKGAVSKHDNGHEDRIWDFEVCTFQLEG